MRKILTILLLMVCLISNAQIHLEYISEKTDSMALINQKDIDIINNVFYEKNILDSLHNLNEQIISNLEIELDIQDSVILTQSQIIANKNLALLELENERILLTETYSKQVEKEKNKKITYQTCTGISVVAIILLILFGK